MSAVVQLADELVNVVLDAFPVGASLLGLPGRDDRLGDYTVAGDDAYHAKVADVAARAGALDPAGLSGTDQVTRGVLLQQAGAVHDRLAARPVEYGVTDVVSAPVPELLTLLPMVPLTDRTRSDGYLERLAAFPRVLDEIAERHRTGIAAGRLPVRHLVDGLVGLLDRYTASQDGDPLRRPDPGEDAPYAAQFRADRDRALDEVVRPALARYREMLLAEVAPHGRPADRGGLCWLPEGEQIYARLVRAHTTTERSPDELHRTGLDLIARLAEEYARIGMEAFGISDPAAVMSRMREDPDLRWHDGEELLEAARTAVERAEREAPNWFGRRPSQGCLVEPVPPDDAPSAAAAYYMQPALDGSRPGIYFANTYRAQERHRHTCEATAFHEAVPGHHFQLTIAQELTELPLLRRLAQVTAFDEGWGLYAERLADEMGLYSSPLARLGMLANDSMRAARLVVDTGLHAKGWSRRQAVDYLTANTAMAAVEVESETDRYMSDPGQALGYMVGRLEIERIRVAAERELAGRFDIRAFHDVVLGNGPLPLGILDSVVGRWAAAA